MTFKKYLLLLLCLPCFVQAKNITISRLTCEMQEGLVVVEAVPVWDGQWNHRRMARDRLLMK